MAKDKIGKKMKKNRGAIRLPIFLPFAGCPFRCIYCQQNAITAQAEILQPNQVAELVQKFVEYRSGQKKEVAFFGGTFTALPLEMQEHYLQSVRAYLPSDDSIRISTRPDCLSVENLALLQKYGVQAVELGVQSFSDEVLQKSGRGYSAQQAIEAVRRLQVADFVVTVQLMPFLPGSSPQSLELTLQTVLDLQPQEVRIYPTLVLAGTQLERLYCAWEYEPTSLELAVQLCCRWKKALESKSIKVIKVGLHSDVSLSAQQVVAGPYHASFGELVQIQALYEKICAENPNGVENLVISPEDTSLYYGHNRLLLRKLERKFGSDFLKSEQL